MKSWSIPVGTLFGVPVRIHMTFLLLLAFVWVTQAAQAGTAGGIRGLALVAIIFGCVVLHELGHAVVAMRHGVNVRSIMLLPIGGITLMDDDAYRNPSAQRDMKIAVAGPVVNLVLAVFFGSAILIFSPHTQLFARPFVYAGDLVRSLFWGNVFLGAFNLLPAYPLDGGRVLRAFLSLRMELVKATRRAVIVGQIFATAFIFSGVIAYGFGYTEYLWLALIGMFLFSGAQMEDRTALFQSVLEKVHMEEIMLTDFATLSPADTLEDALHKAVHSLQDDFPVVRGTDMVGTISRQAITEALREFGNGYVQSAMSRILQVAHRQDTLASVLRQISGHGLSLIPIVDEDLLVGVVTLQNLSHSMSLLAESKRLKEHAAS
jgi:Zn-dependent protease/CBS domain-containing protein